MNPSEMEEKAGALFDRLFHWSQAVLAVGQEKLGKDVNEEMLKAMDTFGGGLGAHGETCGALIGGLAVIGLMFGRSAGDKFADFRMWKYAHQLMRRFKEEITDGSILCREIVGVNWMDQTQVKEYRQGRKHKDCRKLTGKTAKVLGEIIEQATAV